MTMKKSLILCGVIVFKLAGVASAVVESDNSWTVNTAIPEGNPAGIAVSQTLQYLSSDPILGVDVNLKISGGYNAGLYGCLTLQDANGKVSNEILLNQVGTSASNPFGSAGAGMNVTLSDRGMLNGSIHNAAGVPTGMWLPDSPNTLYGTFGGITANGTWTLYLADLYQGGGTSTLESWGLDISMGVVPEPGSYSMLAGAMLLLAGLFRGHWQKLIRGK